MRWFLLLLLVAGSVSAAEPDWLLVAPQRVVAGQPFELIAIAPPDQELPDEISLRVKIDVTEVVLPAQAQGPAVGARRRYVATMPARAGGPATLSLAGRDSNSIALVIARRGDEMLRLTGRQEAAEEPPLTEEDPVYFVLGARDGWSGRFQISFKYRLFDRGAGFGAEQPWLAGFYFGYTQTSLWDLSAESKPFHDTSYRPSFFWKWQRVDQRT